jgi:hypothetical protein
VVVVVRIANGGGSRVEVAGGCCHSSSFSIFEKIVSIHWILYKFLASFISSLSFMVSGNFDLVKSFSAKMSWGKVTVYVLVRKNNRALLFTEVPYFAADEYGAMEANST